MVPTTNGMENLKGYQPNLSAKKGCKSLGINYNAKYTKLGTFERLKKKGVGFSYGSNIWNGDYFSKINGVKG